MTRTRPRKVLRRSRVEWVLGGMAAITLVLLLHDAITEHSPASWRDTPLFHSKWIGGVQSGAVLLAITVSTFIARRQFALTVSPLLRYTTGYRSESKLGLGQQTGRIWCVDVGNTGRGVAIITAVTYDLELVEPATVLEGVGFRQILEAVQATGLRDEHDFVLDNWTVGTSVREGEDRRLWELPDPLRSRVRRLVANFTYASVLGETFETHVSAIPQR